MQNIKFKQFDEPFIKMSLFECIEFTALLTIYVHVILLKYVSKFDKT